MKKRGVVVAKIDDKFYELLKTENRKDNSVYIYFPRNTKYEVRGLSEIELSSITKTVLVPNDMKEIYRPYISYHPGKGVIHVKSEDNNGEIISLISDQPCASLVEFLNTPHFMPIANIVFPLNFLNFNPYKPIKRDEVILLAPTNINNITHLYLEIYVLPRSGYISPEELQFNNIRRLISINHIDNSNPNTELYHCIVVNDLLKSPENDDNADRLTVTVFSKNHPKLFILEPAS